MPRSRERARGGARRGLDRGAHGSVARRSPHVAHARPGLFVPYPVGGGDADDQLDGLGHVEAAVPAHHQCGLLPQPRLHGGDDALDEILGVVGVALEHFHPLPQPARTGLLVRVRLRLHRHDLHHGGGWLREDSDCGCCCRGCCRRGCRVRWVLLLEATAQGPPTSLKSGSLGRGGEGRTGHGGERGGVSLMDT